MYLRQRHFSKKKNVWNSTFCKDMELEKFFKSNEYIDKEAVEEKSYSEAKIERRRE